MSQSEEVNRREVAYRLFAAEFEDADYSYAESDEERAPNYVVTPTGARVNRLFVVGVLTEVEQVNEDVVRARVVDPTGAFVIYAGQYQPEALAALESADTPSFVAVTGKARTFQPDDSDVVYTSIRPEEVSEVDADTRDRWVATAAERTVDRLATMAAAHQRVERDDRLQQVLESAGVQDGLSAGIPLALDHYGTTPDYLDAVRTLALDAARVVAGDREEVEDLSLSPSDGDDAPLDFAADFDVPSDAGEVEPMETDPEAGTVDAEFEDEESEVESGVESESETEVSESETTGESETASDSDETEEAEPASEPESPDEPTPTPEPAAETPSPDEVAAEAKPESGSTEEAKPESNSAEEEEPTPDTESASDTPDEPAEPSGSAADDGEMYEMSEEERQEVEENFDVGFSSGDEIPEGGESDIDVPDGEAEPEPAAEADETESGDEDELGDFDAGDSSEDTETQADESDETENEEQEAEPSDEFTENEDEPESADEEEEDAGSMDLDLEDYVVDLMSELDDSDGALREDVVATATDERDADEDEIEDAIQDALMSGRCYEAGDDHLKAI